MKKTLLAFAAIATIAVGTLSVPSPADARCRGCGIGLGLLGGSAPVSSSARPSPAIPATTPTTNTMPSRRRLPGRRLLGAPPDRNQYDPDGVGAMAAPTYFCR